MDAIKIAQAEPTSEQHGQLLYYDTTYRVFTLVDTRADQGERITTLGPIGDTVRFLQEDFGLTPSQAEEAVGRTFHNLNAPINLDIVRRTAQAEAPKIDEEAVDAVINLSLRMGEERDSDESLITEAAEIAKVAHRIVERVEGGLTEFRWSISAANPSERKGLGRQMTGIRRVLAALHTVLAQGFEDDSAAT